MNPLISCIVPVFNGERYLDEALDSIFAQTYRPLEVIVVDDGSTDTTAEVTTRYGDHITYIWQANAGPSAARNRGVETASGAFIAFLDADDIWHKEKLACQMTRFETRPELEICLSYAQNLWIPDLKQEEERFSDSDLAIAKPHLPSGGVVKRALWERVGPFNTSLKHRDAMDWLARAREAGAVMETVPDVLVFRRIHQDNLSRRRRQSDDADELVRSVKTILDLRRRKSDENA